MRVQKTSTEGRHEISAVKAKTEKSDRFSKILERSRGESGPQFNLAGENQSSAMRDVTPQSERIFTAPASADLERLAAEIVDHISSHRSNGARSVEIQFNSQTLQGLRVSLRSTEQGQVAINFLTPVPRVAGLVQKNLGSLRLALESKGIRVTQLEVSRRPG
ncbi:MAG TPA: flagellar hook-length control protein FliK [Bryobacteraceae bacterium]|jgi:flagellar hook-length control protein FliK|nr:flagellar hook-length control protein FliK [Bryobacteraceae bacterium]